MGERAAQYVPALGFGWLTRFYDPIVRATLNEEKFKRRLIEQAKIQPGHRVLDLGCGTATLTIMTKRTCPGARVVGLDVDAQVLAIAWRKVNAVGVDVELRQGPAFDPPFPPASFDRILSSLLFHHLTTDEKQCTLGRARELLRRGGELHILDWGQAQNLLMRIAFLGIQLLDGFDNTRDNVRGRLIPMMEAAGFASVVETHREWTVFGTLSLYRAVAP